MKAMKAVNVETFGKEKAKDVHKAVTQRIAGQVPVCWNCDLDQSRLGPEKILRACVRCKGIGRTILYCSKECQTNDWKNSRPRPHKSICGQTDLERQPDAQLTNTTTDVSEAEDGPWIPEPEPGYVRSADLLYQIKLLKENPNCEYVLTRPAPDPDIGVQFSNAFGNMMFIISRKRAMQNGESHSVHVMYNFLSESAKGHGIPASDVQKQLEKEYGVKIVPKETSSK